MASANALATLRWKRAKIHRGSRRRRSLTPHKEAGYTSAVVTLGPEFAKPACNRAGSSQDLIRLRHADHRREAGEDSERLCVALGRAAGAGVRDETDKAAVIDGAEDSAQHAAFRSDPADH